MLKFEHRVINSNIELYVNAFQFVNSITDTKNKKVLDWGCRTGNFLYSSYDEFNEKNYTGVDANEQYIKRLKSMFPQANGIHYNIYNNSYNDKGFTKVKWPLSDEQKFDIIFSLSVFTHTSIEEFFDIFNKHKNHLNKNGIIIHTFCDIKDKEFIEYLTNKDQYEKYLNGDFDNYKYFYRYDDNIKTDYYRENVEYLNSFFDADYVKKELNCEIQNNILTCAIYRN